MSEEVKFTKSSGNIFLDIGFSEEEAEHEQLRAHHAFHVYSLFEELKLPPAEAEAHFGMNPVDVSRMQNGDFHLFTGQQLLILLRRLNHNIEIHITPSNEKSGTCESLQRNDIRFAL